MFDDYDYAQAMEDLADAQRDEDFFANMTPEEWARAASAEELCSDCGLIVATPTKECPEGAKGCSYTTESREPF